LNQDLTGRSVVILEDIVDTGNTLVELKELFKAQNVKHFKIATLSLNRKRTKGHQD
jgi:hypoxanthine phosphoribosyltransferase